MESTIAQYGLGGVILWLMFKEVIAPIMAKFTKSDTPPSDQPWNPWQGQIETRVSKLEDSVVRIEKAGDKRDEVLKEINGTLIRVAVKMEVHEDD